MARHGCHDAFQQLRSVAFFNVVVDQSGVTRRTVKTFAEVLKEYALSPAKPVFLGESNYEEESLRGYLTTPEIVRRQEYWAMTSGASGSSVQPDIGSPAIRTVRYTTVTSMALSNT